MAKVEFELNEEGIGALLRSSEMNSVISGIAQKVVGNCGDGYGHREHDTGKRIASNIYPGTEEAYQDNLRNNTLLKGLHL